MDRSRAHRRLVLELQSERYRDSTTFFQYSHVNQVGGRIVDDLSRFELGVVQTIRASSSIRNNRFQLAVRKAHNNFFMRTREEKTTNRIGDAGRSLNNARRSNESLEPVQFGTSETGEPRGVGGKRFAKLIDNLFVGNADFDASRSLGSRRLRSKIFDGWDGRCITAVSALQDTGNERRVDVSEHVLDRFVLDHRILHGNRALQDTDTLGILIKDGLDVLCSP